MSVPDQIGRRGPQFDKMGLRRDQIEQAQIHRGKRLARRPQEQHLVDRPKDHLFLETRAVELLHQFEYAPAFPRRRLPHAHAVGNGHEITLVAKAQPQAGIPAVPGSGPLHGGRFDRQDPALHKRQFTALVSFAAGSGNPLHGALQDRGEDRGDLMDAAAAPPAVLGHEPHAVAPGGVFGYADAPYGYFLSPQPGADLPCLIRLRLRLPVDLGGKVAHDAGHAPKLLTDQKPALADFLLHPAAQAVRSADLAHGLRHIGQAQAPLTEALGKIFFPQDAPMALLHFRRRQKI